MLEAVREAIWNDQRNPASMLLQAAEYPRDHPFFILKPLRVENGQDMHGVRFEVCLDAEVPVPRPCLQEHCRVCVFQAGQAPTT